MTAFAKALEQDNLELRSMGGRSSDNHTSLSKIPETAASAIATTTTATTTATTTGTRLVNGLVLEVFQELSLSGLEEHLGNPQRVISRREVGDRDEDLGELSCAELIDPGHLEVRVRGG